MAVLAPDLVPSAEARRARSKHSELPRCDELRFCALVMAFTHCLETTRALGFINLGPVIQAEFALTGFLLAGFLLKNRGHDETPGLAGPTSKVGTILRIMPTSFLFGIVVALHYLPGILALESFRAPELSEWPALFNKGLRSGLTDFIQGSGEGHSWIAWPLIILFVPRRLLGITFLVVLGSGLAFQFTGLISDELQPASLLVAPSSLDLLAAGALFAAIWQGAGKSGNGALARWALLMVLALVAGSLGFRSRDVLTNWGSLTLLSAPSGFGAVNFILKIMATTLVGSLAWRDIGR